MLVVFVIMNMKSGGNKQLEKKEEKNEIELRRQEIYNLKTEIK